MSDFFQSGPELKNQYQEDRLLRSYLRKTLPKEIHQKIEPDLFHLGERAVTDLWKLAEAAESIRPRHTPYDAWGKRVDTIETSPAWKELDHVSAQERLIAIGYDRNEGIYSRIYQFAKLYLFHPSSAIYTCPLAMTDGAARTIELYGDDLLKNTALKYLTSSDPKEFWTSGQWMTERTGGSDVATTTTVARFEDGEYRLYGTKWFTSATTSQMALTLARTENAQEGGRGLSLFYVKLRNEAGNLNRIQVNRLKDKLGTWALPTAELELQGTPAILVGGEKNGIKKISSLFNITRIYNSCCAIANMRRAIALSRDYANRRVAFGKPLSQNGLHMETLADLQVDFEACFLLTFRAVELLGKDELGKATKAESTLLRLLTPLAKLFTAKKGISITSECLEAFGGAGYVEDTGLPKLLRDSQVLSIWEGTTNVLSLDVLRAIKKENAAPPFFEDLRNRLSSITAVGLLSSVSVVQKAIGQVEKFLALTTEEEDQKTSARHFSMTMAQIYCASLLLEHADWAIKTENDSRPSLVASRWCEKELVQLISSDQERRDQSTSILLS